jgi:(R)-citramalate synthase
MKIEIMDTTLRDGEQTSGISFTAVEKLNMAKLLLDDLKVDRIEVASARVSEGEFKGVKAIVEWASKKNYLDRIEVLGFVDNGVSLNWIKDAGAKVLNLLTKGSLNHVTNQLHKTPEQHSADIKENILLAKKMGFNINVYLEDWSNGMRNSRDYVYFMIDSMQNLPIDRIMLPDTLGILNPDETYIFCKDIIEKYPKLRFDFHAHNDYDLAVANVLSAIKAGVTGLHTTVNGLGERAGNAPLSSVIALLKDHCKVEVSVVEKKINLVSRMVETFSGIRIPANKPIIGDNVFTQTSGVHADGDNKSNLYYNDLLPERFGRVRQYALGKTAGKSNILKNLEQLGIQLDAESMKKVTKRVIELGDLKELVTTEDLPFIIADVLNSEIINSKIKIRNFALSSVNGLKPVATINMEINKKLYEEAARGDGQYDAFMKALKKIYNSLNKKLPKLVDYFVTIPPGGKTDALVETVITWKDTTEFRTRGLDSDQTVAAIKATIKMLNLIEKD